MSSLETLCRFLQPGLQVFLDTLLGMKPDRVKAAGLAGPPQKQNDVVVGFGL